MDIEVDEYRTLRVADFEEEKTTRYDLYYISTGWSTPKNLQKAMKECEPLAGKVEDIYYDFRYEVVSDLEKMEKAGTSHEQEIKAQRELLDQLPKKPKDGVGPWLERMSDAEFKDRIVPLIDEWFDETPDDSVPDAGTAVGAAYEYFSAMSADDLDKLGVQIIEGEHPGSSYYAAELSKNVEEANRAAEDMGITVRFVKA